MNSLLIPGNKFECILEKYNEIKFTLRKDKIRFNSQPLELKLIKSKLEEEFTVLIKNSKQIDVSSYFVQLSKKLIKDKQYCLFIDLYELIQHHFDIYTTYYISIIKSYALCKQGVANDYWLTCTGTQDICVTELKSITKNIELCLKQNHSQSYYIIYNSVCFIMDICSDLQYRGLHKKIIPFIGVSIKSIEFVLELNTAKYLPLLQKLYIQLASCYELSNNIQGALFISNQFLSHVSELYRLEQVNTVSLDGKYKDILEHTIQEAKLLHLKFKLIVLANDSVNSSRAKTKTPNETKKKDYGTEKMSVDVIQAIPSTPEALLLLVTSTTISNPNVLKLLVCILSLFPLEKHILISKMYTELLIDTIFHLLKPLLIDYLDKHKIPYTESLFNKTVPEKNKSGKPTKDTVSVSNQGTHKFTDINIKLFIHLLSTLRSYPVSPYMEYYTLCLLHYLREMVQTNLDVYILHLQVYELECFIRMESKCYSLEYCMPLYEKLSNFGLLKGEAIPADILIKAAVTLVTYWNMVPDSRHHEMNYSVHALAFRILAHCNYTNILLMFETTITAIQSINSESQWEEGYQLLTESEQYITSALSLYFKSGSSISNPSYLEMLQSSLTETVRWRCLFALRRETLRKLEMEKRKITKHKKRIEDRKMNSNIFGTLSRKEASEEKYWNDFNPSNNCKIKKFEDQLINDQPYGALSSVIAICAVVTFNEGSDHKTYLLKANSYFNDSVSVLKQEVVQKESQFLSFDMVCAIFISTCHKFNLSTSINYIKTHITSKYTKETHRKSDTIDSHPLPYFTLSLKTDEVIKLSKISMYWIAKALRDMALSVSSALVNIHSLYSINLLFMALQLAAPTEDSSIITSILSILVTKLSSVTKHITLESIFLFNPLLLVLEVCTEYISRDDWSNMHIQFMVAKVLSSLICITSVLIRIKHKNRHNLVEKVIKKFINCWNLVLNNPNERQRKQYLLANARIKFMTIYCNKINQQRKSKSTDKQDVKSSTALSDIWIETASEYYWEDRVPIEYIELLWLLLHSIAKSLRDLGDYIDTSVLPLFVVNFVICCHTESTDKVISFLENHKNHPYFSRAVVYFIDQLIRERKVQLAEKIAEKFGNTIQSQYLNISKYEELLVSRISVSMSKFNNTNLPFKDYAANLIKFKFELYQLRRFTKIMRSIYYTYHIFWVAKLKLQVGLMKIHLHIPFNLLSSKSDSSTLMDHDIYFYYNKFDQAMQYLIQYVELTRRSKYYKGVFLSLKLIIELMRYLLCREVPQWPAPLLAELATTHGFPLITQLILRAHEQLIDTTPYKESLLHFLEHSHSTIRRLINAVYMLLLDISDIKNTEDSVCRYNSLFNYQNELGEGLLPDSPCLDKYIRTNIELQQRNSLNVCIKEHKHESHLKHWSERSMGITACEITEAIQSFMFLLRFTQFHKLIDFGIRVGTELSRTYNNRMDIYILPVVIYLQHLNNQSTSNTISKFNAALNIESEQNILKDTALRLVHQYERTINLDCELQRLAIHVFHDENISNDVSDLPSKIDTGNISLANLKTVFDRTIQISQEKGYCNVIYQVLPKAGIVFALNKQFDSSRRVLSICINSIFPQLPAGLLLRNDYLEWNKAIKLSLQLPTSKLFYLIYSLSIDTILNRYSQLSLQLKQCMRIAMIIHGTIIYPLIRLHPTLSQHSVAQFYCDLLYYYSDYLDYLVENWNAPEICNLCHLLVYVISILYSHNFYEGVVTVSLFLLACANTLLRDMHLVTIARCYLLVGCLEVTGTVKPSLLVLESIIHMQHLPYFLFNSVQAKITRDTVPNSAKNSRNAKKSTETVFEEFVSIAMDYNISNSTTDELNIQVFTMILSKLLSEELANAFCLVYGSPLSTICFYFIKDFLLRIIRLDLKEQFGIIYANDSEGHSRISNKTYNNRNSPKQVKNDTLQSVSQSAYNILHKLIEKHISSTNSTSIIQFIDNIPTINDPTKVELLNDIWIPLQIADYYMVQRKYDISIQIMEKLYSCNMSLRSEVKCDNSISFHRIHPIFTIITHRTLCSILYACIHAYLATGQYTKAFNIYLEAISRAKKYKAHHIEGKFNILWAVYLRYIGNLDESQKLLTTNINYFKYDYPVHQVYAESMVLFYQNKYLIYNDSTQTRLQDAKNVVAVLLKSLHLHDFGEKEALGNKFYNFNLKLTVTLHYMMNEEVKLLISFNDYENSSQLIQMSINLYHSCITAEASLVAQTYYLHYMHNRLSSINSHSFFSTYRKYVTKLPIESNDTILDSIDHPVFKEAMRLCPPYMYFTLLKGILFEQAMTLELNNDEKTMSSYLYIYYCIQFIHKICNIEQKVKELTLSTTNTSSINIPKSILTNIISFYKEAMSSNEVSLNQVVGYWYHLLINLWKEPVTSLLDRESQLNCLTNIIQSQLDLLPYNNYLNIRNIPVDDLFWVVQPYTVQAYSYTGTFSYSKTFISLYFIINTNDKAINIHRGYVEALNTHESKEKVNKIAKMTLIQPETVETPWIVYMSVPLAILNALNKITCRYLSILNQVPHPFNQIKNLQTNLLTTLYQLFCNVSDTERFYIGLLPSATAYFRAAYSIFS